MGFLRWLQELARSTSPAGRFHARPEYVIVSVALPVAIGLFVGFSLRLLERLFGIELGKHGSH